MAPRNSASERCRDRDPLSQKAAYARGGESGGFTDGGGGIFFPDRGGAIFNSGTLTITLSTITANSTRSSGGGIFNNRTLTVTRSTISDNRAV